MTETKADTIIAVGIILFIFAFMLLILGPFLGLIGPISSWSNFLTIFGVVFTVTSAIIMVFGVILKAKEKAPPPQVQTTPIMTKEKEIIKEIVMIPCAHCGGLMPQTSVFCPNCGARRRV